MNPKLKSPALWCTVLLALLGALLPLSSMVRTGGLRGSLNDAGLMVALWGASPFALPPISAWIARRSWVRTIVAAFVALSVIFALVTFFSLLPQRSSSDGTLLYIFLPIWQWPMSVLGAGLALFVPSAEQERSAPANGVPTGVPEA